MTLAYSYHRILTAPFKAPPLRTWVPSVARAPTTTGTPLGILPSRVSRSNFADEIDVCDSQWNFRSLLLGRFRSVARVYRVIIRSFFVIKANYYDNDAAIFHKSSLLPMAILHIRSNLKLFIHSSAMTALFT